MTEIKITFEKGGVFHARLLEDAAPDTCKKFLAALPFSIVFSHSTCSGDGIVCFPQNILVKPENQRTCCGIVPGTLSFLVKNPDWHVPYEIYITYGENFISRGYRIDYQEPINVFGQIYDNLGELAEVGKRIHHQGDEKVTISVE